MDQISSDTIIIEEQEPTGDDEKVRIYGSTGETSPSHAKKRSDDVYREGEYDRKENHKPTSLLLPSPTASHKVIVQSEHTHVSTRSFPDAPSWMQHPKIRENWKVVIGALLLTVVGAVMFLVGIGIVVSPSRGMHCLVFIVGGLLCLIPGAYHLVYIWLALRGCDGYSLYDLPVFN